MRWIELAEGVYARRYAELDQTLGLVLGTRHCLVVDTGTDEAHGSEWAAAIREITPLPWTIVLTHAHWDHVLGTRAFLPAPVYAHPRCRAAIADSIRGQVREWSARYREQGDPERATRMERVAVLLPDRPVDPAVELDLGGRSVRLAHLGAGHTDHDVLVHVPDARVVFAGDTVEQGAPPSIGPDSDVAAWPALLDALLAMTPDVVVPGHGDPVGAEFVRAQRAELAALPATPVAD